MRDLSISSAHGAFTAIFIDYENVYYHLRNTYADIPELSDFMVEL